MPMNYLALIGDMGSALYRNPKVLFLDEGTAHLDEITERTIVEIIEHLDITRVVIAHRPEFLKKVDRIISINS